MIYSMNGDLELPLRFEEESSSKEKCFFWMIIIYLPLHALNKL